MWTAEFEQMTLYRGSEQRYLFRSLRTYNRLTICSKNLSLGFNPR